jgi:hypothetical protein
MQDRTIKFLLATVAVALWGLLLRPLLTSTPVQAAPQAQPPAYPAIALPTQYSGMIYVVQDRTLYKCQDLGGKVQIISRTPLR